MSPPQRRTSWVHWAAAFPAVLLAMGLRGLLDPMLDESVAFVFAFPAVVLLSLWAGSGPAIVAVLGCAVWAATPFLPPSLRSTTWPLQIGAFAASGILLAIICGQLRVAAPSIVEIGDGQPGAPLPSTPVTTWLYATMAGAVLLPATFFVAAAWWGYESAHAEARQGAERATVVTQQHALLAFRNVLGMAIRADQITLGLERADLPHLERNIYQRLDDITIEKDVVVEVTVWDADDRLLAHSRIYPIDTEWRLPEAEARIGRRQWQAQWSDAPSRPDGQDDLHRLHVGPPTAGGVTRGTSVSVTLPRTPVGNRYNGVIVLSVSPEHFTRFYRGLASEQPGVSTVALSRADGVLITRWPAPPETLTQLPPGSAFRQATEGGAPHGVVEMSSSFDGARRLIAYRRVDVMPLYVAAGRSEDMVLRNWFQYMQLLGGVTVPCALGLVWITWVALRRARREQEAVRQLKEENRRRAHAEQALLQSQKLEAVGQLTGGVAHDFNNLLMVVNTSAHLLKRLHPDVARGNHVAAIERAVASGVKLTRQLLAFSRRQALRPEVIRLQEWLPGMQDLLRASLGRQIDMLLDIAPDAHCIEVDTAELELALINLAVNAKDAMPQGGEIVVRVRNVRGAEALEALPGGLPAAHPRHAALANRADAVAQVEWVELSLTDSGMGIAPEHLAKVFEPFFTTKPTGQGTGLGLSQVYGLCVQAGGTARVASQEHQGTTVSLWFPASEQSPSAAPRPDLHGEQRLHGRLLLVEDNDEVAGVNRPLLESFGLAVQRVDSARSALAALEGAGPPFDVVLADIVMPGSMDGLALAIALRQRLPHLPVILMTGYTAQIQKAVAAGFQVLPKPTEPAVLYRALDAAIASTHREAAAPAQPAATR